MRGTAIAIVGIVCTLLPASGVAAEPLVEQYLRAGKLAEGETALLRHLKQNPDDEQAIYGLGMLQFLRAVEDLSQSMHRYGLNPANGWVASSLPFLRMPIPVNKDPEPINYAQMRQVYVELLADLQRTEQTLARIEKTDVKLPIHFGQIRLDLNDDGQVANGETLWRIYARLNRRVRISDASAAQFVISFDYADALWMRGYCHLLSALGEFILAHDWQESFERTGQLFFPRVKGQYEYLRVDEPRQDRWWSSSTQIADAIAFIHLVNFKVAEPDRMQSALTHLEEVIRLSRQTWDAIELETDNDREWIPGPHQTGVVPNVRVSKEMLKGWREFLDEAESILAGKTLIPHWRVVDGRGINLRKVFTDPKPFDVVMWMQGTGAEPFLEEGPVSQRATWQRLQSIFGGQFIGFATWFN